MAFFYTANGWAVIKPDLKRTSSDRGDGSYGWSLPRDEVREMYKETLAPEDLLVNPEDIDLIPAQVQYGDSLWGVDTLPIDLGWYIVPVPDAGSWYLWGGDFPVDSGWYMVPGSY